MEKAIAKALLQINAVKLSPAKPFTWASGWHSPIYCDNRTVLSYTKERKLVADSFAKAIRDNFGGCEVIAGVATGAIAWGVMAAEVLDKPFIYVRSAAKSHGLTNQVEGFFKKGQKVVVVEDLISTGGSSLAAVEALREAGCVVMGMVSIFTYGFNVATENFKRANVELVTLSNYKTLIEMAVEQKYVDENQVETLNAWRVSPESWGK